ncbi:52 kDa repressor of the inhibitor of the protein kinase-like [Aphis gossypii]|uniref:52 kDa repressor of the inhibitor of the protein kinase-like n=1 Tax=Aphis gossypii TaxID=80765 RepID=UPI002159B054|nr:52 kDa repressor of the inhibitor of the protein kinase-like [Aphis gossypii]XP_050059822.1 52 kDa repressor of the inhibitor of the protein kinase-like [Aphis gossypii]
MKRSINDYFVSKVRCVKNSSNVTNNRDVSVSNLTQVPDKDEQNVILSTPVPKNSSIFDIKLFIDKKLTKTEKTEALNTIWTPGKNYDFPITLYGSKNLKFQMSWFDKWSWIAYSGLDDGIYCKYCVLFCVKQGGKGGQSLGQLCTQPLKNWKHAIQKLKSHEAREESSVYDQINKVAKKQKDDNRKIISPVIQSVILCGRQGIALRGHQDCGPLKLTEPSENDGNFRALLRFYLNATQVSGDNTHVLLRENCKKNAQYYNSDDGKMHEDFLKFVPIYEVNGRNLANIIVEELKNMNIEVNNLRGQGYDGAAVMSGKMNGVAVLVKKEYPTALYIHCSSHNLNLSISYSCNIPEIRNTMGTIESGYLFLNTPKRQIVFSEKLNLFKEEEKLKDDGCQSKKLKLKRLCPTRWVERHNSVEIFYDFLPVILSSLEEMITWSDKDTATKANQLLLALQASEFNISLKQNIDLCEAINHINIIIKELMTIRENAETVFSDLFKIIVTQSKEMDIEIKIPRLAKRQKHRCNIMMNTPEEYYRVSIFIPFIESIIEQLNDRFNNHREIISGFQALIDYNIKTDLQQLVHFYQNDIECYDKVVIEINLWHRFLRENNIKPTSALDALSKCNPDFYKNVYTLLHILVVLPVTSCEAERTFSSLKRIKNYLRNTNSENRLNGLANLNIHREVPVTVEEVINILSEENRRLDFTL